MASLVPVDYDPFAAPPVSPQTAVPAMPPGTVPGAMNAQPGIETSMVPLSPEAERAKRLLKAQTLSGNRGGVAGAQDLLLAEPTYQAQKAQSTQMGKDAADRSAMKRTGINILRSYAQLQHSFDETPDDILKDAIGPYNAQPAPENHGWLPSLTTTPGMTPPQAAAAAKQANPYNILNPTRWYGNADAWNTQNLFQHDVHGLTNSFMTGAGKGMNMSDKRQETFDSTMKDFMKASNREAAKEVLGHAKTIIMNDFGLSPREADEAINQHLKEIKEAKAAEAIKASGSGAGQGVPPAAIKMLRENLSPEMLQHFDAKYGPGMAKKVLNGG